MNVFIMQNSIVRPLGRDMQNVLIGFVGEHEARTFFVRTRDDLTGYTVGLVIDDVDCGAMTKAPMPDGSTMLSLTLTSDMLGNGGDKVCQLLMVKNTIVRKSSQFRAYVGASNDINSTAPDSATIIIISEKITELVHEAALDAIEEVQEVIDSIPADYSALSGDVTKLKADLGERFNLKYSTNSIASNSDLNDYTDIGQYRILTADIARTVANVPQIKAGQLIVQRVTQAGTTVQTYMTSGDPTEVYRRYVSMLNEPYTYYPWHKVARSDELEVLSDEMENKLSLTPSTDSLTTGDDLNELLTPGQYTVPSQAVARSLLNKPIEYKYTGTITVINTHNTNHVYQIIMTNGMSNIWIRHIRIDIQQYDAWKSLANNEIGYSWSAKDFIVHDPVEENTEMIDCVEKYLGRTITASEGWATNTDGIRDISSADIYTMWDALQQEYPDYIDEGEIIGYSLDTTGQNYAPIKAYYIHPKLTYGNNVSIQYEDMPTIYIVAGTHGGEGSPTWNLFAIFHRALQTGTIYSELLDGVKFRVIPCLSRWGYDHLKRYLAAAYNSDGTIKEECINPETGEIYDAYDANRMCICTDDANPTYASLNIPTYAGEAKALTKYMNDHNFGAVSGDSFLDLHNCSYSLGYLSSVSVNIQKAYNRMMDGIAKDWRVHSPWKNGDMCYYYNTSTSDHFSLRGKILGRTPSINTYAWFFGSAYTPFTANTLEVQQSDGTACNAYAIAKGLDITYRWLMYVTEHIRG